MSYTKTNTKLTKEINGQRVQTIVTVEGRTGADWMARHTQAIKELKGLGYKINA